MHHEGPLNTNIGVPSSPNSQETRRGKPRLETLKLSHGSWRVPSILATPRLCWLSCHTSSDHLGTVLQWRITFLRIFRALRRVAWSYNLWKYIFFHHRSRKSLNAMAGGIWFQNALIVAHSGPTSGNRRTSPEGFQKTYHLVDGTHFRELGPQNLIQTWTSIRKTYCSLASQTPDGLLPGRRAIHLAQFFVRQM
jgi:hypothetical protein